MTVLQNQPSPEDRAKTDESYVRANFGDKLRRVGRRVPFAEDAVAAYFCLVDDETPKRVRVILGSALAYFITPVDLVPDFIALLGFADDASVLALAYSSVAKHIRPGHRARARELLEGKDDLQVMSEDQPKDPEPPG